MKTLNVNVTNKVAVYSQRGGAIVCDNKSSYQIKFTFDAEWNEHSLKTARFVYNGGYYDVDFTGDTVTVPEVRNATSISVGVFAENLCTTTPATIACVPSILSLSDTPSEDNDRNYANEAKEAAERAEAAAETAAAEAAHAVVDLAAEQMLGGIVQTTGDSETQVMSQKATTEAILDIFKEAGPLEKTVTTLVDVFFGPIEFSQGAITDNNGGLIIEGRANRIYTREYIDTSITKIKVVDNSFQFSVHLYDSENVYQGAFDGNSVGTFAWLQEVDISALNGSQYFIRLMFRASDNSDITPEAANNLKCAMGGEYITPLTEQVSALEAKVDRLESGDNTETEIGHKSIGNRLWDAAYKKGKYEAWPFGNAWFDISTGKHCLIVNVKSTHTSTDGDVYFTSKYDYGNFDPPVLVAQHTSTYGCRCHGAGIDANGNYIALVLHYDSSNNGKIYVYKSANKGVSWSASKMIIDGTDPTSGETGSCFLTKSGRLLTFNRLAPSPQSGCMIAYSNDNGTNWSGTTINNGTAPNPLEGSFIELSNGNIYCVVRGNLYTGDYTQLQKTYITKSTDGGITWTPLAEMDDIDATFNGVAFVHHVKAKKVEMIYASRLLNHNGVGTLYRRICTETEFEAGYYGEEVKIGDGGSVGADFGYVATSISDKNVVNMYYYITDETDGGVCIKNAELGWIY